ncbi:MAG: beta-galactosidase trimerization domain-containing protein [Lachnospiraceae bacterium]|nr:beta-galactosidase trimerization domain-containing protein [Lachnospiraceae bacterium]
MKKDNMNFRQIHLDFHTSEKISGIGADFNKKQYQEALLAGHINSVTTFSKCHHGYAYHPTKVNDMHPGLNFDLLKAQIEAAHEIGVKTPGYISVGYDEKSARRHPEWLHQDREHHFDNFSVPHYHLMCLNTPYLDYVLNQIAEVVENYDVDGLFLDIVGVRACYCNTCVKTMLDAGLDPDDPENALALGEKVYANYVKRVRETVDAIKPGLPIFHNGGHIRKGRRDLAYANTHLELESLPTGGWGYDHFPMSARYVQNLNLEYLGMTGKFHTSWGEFGGFKHPNALRYETALSVAHGAKCSIGDQLAPNGRMDMTTYELIGQAYAEIEEKEPWLHQVTPVCDIALLTQEAVANSHSVAQDGSGQGISDVGASRMLLEGHYQFSIVDMETDFNQYKVMILPDNIPVDETLASKLRAFVNNGGKLLASGTSGICAASDSGFGTAKGFLFDFGAAWKGTGEFIPSYVRPLQDNPYESDYIMYTPYQRVKADGGRLLAHAVPPYFNRTAEHFCSHLHTPSAGMPDSAGMIEGPDGIYIAWEIFRDYAERGELIAKRVVHQALDILLGKRKSIQTNLGSMGVTTFMKQTEENRYIAHLLYAVPTKRGNGIEVIEDIYPVSGIEITVNVPEPIKKVTLEPQGKEIPFTYEDNCVTIKDITVDCHQMIVLHY